MNNRHLASPHLRMVLEQLRTELSSGDELYQAFLESVQERGAEEVGYERPEGQTFNPRSARIAIILLQNGKVRNSGTLKEALALAGQGAKFEGYLDPAANTLVDAAFLLDRVRHLHLERSPNVAHVLRCAERVSAAIASSSSELSLLLEKGVERFRRRQTEK